MSTRRRFFIWLGGVVLILGIAIYFSRDFWMPLLSSYAMQQADLAGQEYGPLLPAVDEIEILALGEEVPDGTPDSCPLGREAPRRIVNRCTIRNTKAEDLANLWRQMTFDRSFSAACHEPYYVLRFRHHGRLMLETSICWMCQNVTLPVGWFGQFTYGFDAEAESAQKLRATLNQYAPHPPTVP